MDDLIERAKAKGSPEDYLKWLSKNVSCISGKYSEYLESGECRSIVAHVRRVNRGAGTAKKPDYWAVPMTDTEHRSQHGYGESWLSFLLAHYHPDFKGTPKEFLDEQAEKHLEMWIAS